MFEKFFGGNKKEEELKNKAEEITSEEISEESEAESQKPLSPEAKARISANKAINPDLTLHIPADETKFGNDQERAT